MNHFRKISLTTATLLTLAFATTASASSLNYDASLQSPGTSGQPGWYDGSGNPNGGFTIDSENGVEVGLRAKLRQDPDVIHSSDGTYIVPVGSQPGQPTKAAWNYEFSIDLQPLGVGSLTLDDINASLSIYDTNANTTATVNPLTYWSDDVGFGPSGKTNSLFSGEWGAQNSENPAFGDFPLAASFNMNAVDTYVFTLDVTNKVSGAQLASDQITVGAQTPEPGTIVLMFGALGAVAFLTNRKRRQSAS